MDAAASPPSGEPKVRLAGVEKSFGDKRVLRGVDLEVAAGSSTVIIGGSGTGKSVLLKHVIGLLAPDAGTVTVDGVRLDSLDRRELTRFRRRFGMAFQEGALFDSMTVAENVGFPLTRSGDHEPEAVAARVADCLAKVKLSDAGGKLPSELSGGMRRRVGFARAIALEPDILLFDEPTTGLDPVTKETIDELIVELSAELGSTSITISHDMGSVFRIADTIAMLYEGKIIAAEPPEAFRRLDDPRVREFLRRDLPRAAAG